MKRLPLDYAPPTLPPERLGGPGRWLIIVLIAITIVAIGVYIFLRVFVFPKLGSAMP